MIRVFPHRTEATPTDALAFIGEPPLFRPPKQPVRVSVSFTWQKAEGERLACAWRKFYPDVQIGGPAFDDPGGEFTPGVFLRQGYVITSRGCPMHCDFCLVPGREGKLRELEIKEGWDVCDNNLLACSHQHLERVFAMLRRQHRGVRFSGGLQAERVNDEVVGLLHGLRIECLWLAYDRPGQACAVQRAISRLRSAGLRQRQVGCYCLIGQEGDTLTSAESRLRQIYEWGGLPFAMLYRGDGQEMPSKEWRKFQRVWCRPAIIYARIKGGAALRASRGP